jgi:hypothetical protein
VTKIMVEPLLGGEPFEIDAANIPERDEGADLFNLIKEAAAARHKAARQREQEQEATATLGELERVFEKYISEKHAALGCNTINGRVSVLTPEDKTSFNSLLEYVKRWRLITLERGWSIPPALIAAWLVDEYGKGADIKALHKSVGRMHDAYLNPVNSAEVRAIFEFLTTETDERNFDDESSKDQG